MTGRWKRAVTLLLPNCSFDATLILIPPVVLVLPLGIPSLKSETSVPQLG